jgi:hypothetical protein
MAEAVGVVRTEATFETAQFEEGTKRARQALGQFDRATKDTGGALAGIQRQFAAVANAVRGLAAAFAVQQTVQFAASMIQGAAALSRLSEQAGVTVTQFQQLRFAFRDANLGEQEFAQSLAIFARNMSDLQRNTGPFLQFLRESAPQFIANFQAADTLSDQLLVLGDVVARLGDRQDRVRVLTAAGGDAFGRLAADMPNLRQRLAEAERGFTGVSEEAAKSAREIEREYRAIVTNITSFLQGLVVGIVNTFRELPLEAEAERLRQAIRGTQERIDRLTEGTAMYNVRVRERIELERQLAAVLLRLNPFPTTPPGNERLADPNIVRMMQAELQMFLQLAEGSRTLQQSLFDLTNTQTMFGSTTMQGLEGLNFAWMTHADIVAAAQERIRQSYTDTAEAQRMLASVTQQLNVRYQQQVGQTAQAVGQALVAVFPKSKAAAAAQALINTAVGVTQALTLPFPLNWIQAAAVLASGMAQVAAIKSASVGGGGALPSPGGGGSGGGGGGEGAGAAPTRIVIEQVDPNAFFSGVQLNNLIDAINNQAENGRVVIASKLV